MPLPKPPATKATILSPADFESQAAPRASRKGGKPRAEPAALRLAASAPRERRGRPPPAGPIHKARLAAQGFHHPGHTTFLGELCGVADPVMAFVGGALRVSWS